MPRTILPAWPWANADAIGSRRCGAPRFDSNFQITSTTNSGSADCIDTTPAGTASLCTETGTSFALGQRPYTFAITSTASGAAPPAVGVSGSFTDGIFAFAISNTPTISAGGVFGPSGQFVIEYIRAGVFAPPRSSVLMTMREDWTVTAASKDSFVGSASVVFTPSGNNCGEQQKTACTGNVTITRTILTAQRK